MSGNTASADGAAPAADGAVAAFVSFTGATTTAAKHYLALPAAGGDVQVAVGLYFQAADADGSGSGGAVAPGDTGTVEAFVAATNATPAVAAQFLEMTGGDLAMAVSLYLDVGPGQPADADAPSGTGVGGAAGPAAKRQRTDAHASGAIPGEGAEAAAQGGGAVREVAAVSDVATETTAPGVGCVPAPPFAALGFRAGPRRPAPSPRLARPGCPDGIAEGVRGHAAAHVPPARPGTRHHDSSGRATVLPCLSWGSLVRE